MSNGLTARRTRPRDDGSYDWIIGVGPNPKPHERLVLIDSRRSYWPTIVRDFGYADVDAIAFTSFRERAIFVLDCDLLDERVSKARNL